MKFKIFKGEELINTIESDINFIERYCNDRGYTFQVENDFNFDKHPSPVDQLRADVDFIAIMTGVEL